MERETGIIFKNYQLLQQEMESTSNSILNNINSSLGANQSSNVGGGNEHAETSVSSTANVSNSGGGSGTVNLSLPGLGLEQEMIDFLNEGLFSLIYFEFMKIKVFSIVRHLK